jgi:hypothetical protein
MTAATPRVHPFEPFPGTDAETFIQWKGTEVCMDLHCPCGTHSHIDADFAYRVRCAGCGDVYELGTQVKAVRRSPEEADDGIKIVDGESLEQTIERDEQLRRRR